MLMYELSYITGVIRPRCDAQEVSLRNIKAITIWSTDELGAIRGTSDEITARIRARRNDRDASALLPDLVIYYKQHVRR